MNPTGKGGFGDHPEHAVHVGRPAKGQSLTEKILKILEEKGISLEEIMAGLITDKDVRAVLHTYDHVDGRPMQKTEITTPDEHPFELIINDNRGKKNDDETG